MMEFKKIIRKNEKKRCTGIRPKIKKCTENIKISSIFTCRIGSVVTTHTYLNFAFRSNGDVAMSLISPREFAKMVGSDGLSH